MRNKNDVCHIAIACNDLDEAIDFYQNTLGCNLARRKDDRVTFNFFGDQLVCHLSPKDSPKKMKPYPYHFGITFSLLEDFENLRYLLIKNNVELLQDHVRFKGQNDEHRTLFFSDPSNNVLEFKHYIDDKMKY